MFFSKCLAKDAFSDKNLFRFKYSQKPNPTTLTNNKSILQGEIVMVKSGEDIEKKVSKLLEVIVM